MDWDDHITRSDEARRKIFGLEYAVQKDLSKLLHNLEETEKQLSIEAIECRKHQTTTRRYVALEEQTKAALNTLEQYLILAMLMDENKDRHGN